MGNTYKRFEKSTKEKDEKQSFHVKHSNEQLVYGLRPVLEALDSDRQIDRILLQKGVDGSLVAELKKKVAECHLPIQYVPVEKLNRMAAGNHQGVVATISPVGFHTFADLLDECLESGKCPFFVMLDHVTDVRNMGAIVRTAECVGVHGVIVPDYGSAQINEDAVKTSSGALLRLPICRESNLKTVVNLAKQSGIKVIGATEKGSANYLDVDFTEPILLVMGAEDIGISPEILKLCDERAKLPIMGNIQSLNVSVAAAVFMYEVLRQRAAAGN